MRLLVYAASIDPQRVIAVFCSITVFGEDGRRRIAPNRTSSSRALCGDESRLSTARGFLLGSGPDFDGLERRPDKVRLPFERLLDTVQKVARSGSTVLILTARDPTPFVARLRRIERGGCRVLVVACGQDAVADAGRARTAGFAARAVRLDGPWRTADRLQVAR